VFQVKRQVYELPSAPVYFLLELRGRLRQWRIVASGAVSSGTCPPPAVISRLALRHAAHPHSPHRVAAPPSAPSDRFRRSQVCSCVTPIVSPFLRPMMTPTLGVPHALPIDVSV